MPVAASLRTTLGVTAKAGGSAILIALLASHVEFGRVRDTLAAVSFPALALACAPFLIIPLLGGLRWWFVLRGLGKPCRLGTIVMLFSVAGTAAQMLPSLAGDGVRAWLAARRGLGVQAALHSVLLERALMVLALAALALATAPLLAARTGTSGPLWVGGGLLACGLLALGLLACADRIAVPWRNLRQAAAPTRALLASRWGAGAIGLSVLSNLNFALAALLLARALAIHATAADLLAIMPAVTLATTLPVSLGGWGMREGALVLLLGRVGVPQPDALALSLLFGALALLCGLPGLLAWCLQQRSRNLSGLRWRSVAIGQPTYGRTPLADQDRRGMPLVEREG